MYAPALDRRKNGFFRILFMDFRSFWNRIVMRRKGSQGAPARPKAAIPAAHLQAEPKGGVGFTTGVAKLDEQHQGIREAILNLQKDLGRGGSGPAVLQSLDAMLQRMNDHFHYEESYLEHIKFPDLVHHKGEHDRFRTDVLQLRDRLESGDQGAALDLSAFLFNWFRRHTLEEDATFAKKKKQP